MTGDWTTGPMVGFDLETTGVDVEQDRIVQYAIVVARPGRDPMYVDGLVNPGIDIPAGASDIHGITNARAREDGAPRTEALPRILHTLGRAVNRGWPVVAMNGCYDLTLLDRELWRVGLPALETYARQPVLVIDPLVLDRHLDRHRATKEADGRTLTNLASLYAVEQGQAHDAVGDVETTMRLAAAIASRYPQLVRMGLDELHRYQQHAHREWAVHFSEWLDERPGEHEAVRTDWPLTPRPVDTPQERAATQGLMRAIYAPGPVPTRHRECEGIILPPADEPIGLAR